MSYKTKAERILDGAVSAFKEEMISESDVVANVQIAQAHATLAVVEQLRISNLIALATSPDTSAEVERQAIDALTYDAGNGTYPLNPATAAALGIGGDA